MARGAGPAVDPEALEPGRAFPYRRRMKKLACAIAIALAACSGDDGGATDAGVDAPIDAPSVTCGTPAATLTTYPAMFTGSTDGAGNDLTVADSVCAEQNGYFGASGEDQLVELTGLTAGTTYVIELDTDDDLSFYVTTGCLGGMPADDACLLHVDARFTDEVGQFVAPAGGAVFVVIDSFDGSDPPPTGDYTLRVHAFECEDDSGCTGDPDGPVCFNNACVECGSAFDCTAAEPVCDGAHTCVPGPAMCTGDDAGESDDGPGAARSLAFPTAATPTTTSAAVCTLPPTEADWYTFTAPAAGSVRITATWTATPDPAPTDLDFRIYDAEGALVDRGISTEADRELLLVSLPAAGAYYVEVQRYEPMNQPAATAYTLTLAIPQCDDAFDCTAAGMPVCDDTGTCVAGFSQCVGDDLGDATDDGPAGARTLNGAIGVAQSLAGSICNTPAGEADWYRVDVGAGEGATLQLEWTMTTVDLDLAVFDAQGRLVGLGFWLNPESVRLTYLPAGAYYLRVVLVGNATTAVVPYTVRATRSVAQTCTSRTDCAAEFANQVYRGNCASGVCQFIAPGALATGMPCDSGDDCMSERCSYSIFESDAQDSVCSIACTATSQCTTALGAGFACTAGLGADNHCQPTCGNDFECGVDPNAMPAAGNPWDYLTCTSGVCSL